VSPPDAVAAKAVLHHLHLPRRLMTILEGESLIAEPDF
jgi:NhaP-type Na+/H+ or K+/H+ antiporter